eukprot:CAMPEP_0198201826 /NCGR_PEP_ID=MMETSP1445-20131203/4857_1 /TAXON_ID=36898 /ORGANISM="Pyramimonas sp., Strain CCMP2087" /LENGTH=496 /DNA_ID=CAMNT_0043872459 /DNA_START=151 /DNA_END=1641 /DNA_ORIENTATION=-
MVVVRSLNAIIGEIDKDKRFSRKSKRYEKESEREEDWGEWAFECVCKKRRCKNYDDGDAMIECDKCSVWTHTKCNGIRGRVKAYICRKCSQGDVGSKATALKGRTTAQSVPVQNPLLSKPPTQRGTRKKNESQELENTSPNALQTEETTHPYFSTPATPHAEPTSSALDNSQNGPKSVPKAPKNCLKGVEGAWSRFEKLHSGTEAQRKILTESEKVVEASAVLSEYEKERLKNIEKNLAMLEALGIKGSMTSLSASLAKSTHAYTCLPTAGSERKPPRQQKGSRATRIVAQTRKSRRHGPSVDGTEETSPSEDSCADSTIAEDETPEDSDAQLTLDEYYQKAGIVPGPWMEGHYRGWVKAEVRQRMGLAASSKEAWDSNGGGAFSRKPPPGMSVKEHARRLMHKNPNGFFYRHNEPGEDQWAGNWTKEEIAHFIDVAEANGCGDKWGLFSSHIPHRVGYQCSAVYRQVIIPAGLLRDPNFKISASGVAIWASAKNT